MIGSICRAQEVLKSLGIKSNWRFGADEANGNRKEGEGTEEAQLQQLPGQHDASQLDQDAQEPNSKRLKTADVSAASAVVSPAATDVSAAFVIATCADSANGSAKAEDGQQLKVFDVAWRLSNEVIPGASPATLRLR